MKVNQDILNFIRVMRENSAIEMQCYSFHLVLSAAFKGITPYYDGNHVISELGGVFYDWHGLVRLDIVKSSNYIPLSEYGDSIVESLIVAKTGFYRDRIMSLINRAFYTMHKQTL